MNAQVVVMPSVYRALYYRWEQEQWSAASIDLAGDRREWTEDADAIAREQVEAFIAFFYEFSTQAAQLLVAFVDAAPTEEQHVFLTTQLVDHARHVVFFDRVWREVVTGANRELSSDLDLSDRLNPGCRDILFELLPRAAREVAERCDDRGAFVEGITLLDIVVENTIVVTLQKFLSGHFSSHAVLPGLRDGFGSIVRDAARHVDFAVESLRLAVGERGDLVGRIRDAVARSRADVRAAFAAPLAGGGLPYSPEQARSWAFESLNKRLRAVGAELIG